MKHILEITQFLDQRLACQLEGFAVAVAVMVIWGILDVDLEWCCLVLLGAMYAVTLVFSTNRLYREETPRTFCFGFGFLILLLS